jgi:hypothetical protein
MQDARTVDGNTLERSLRPFLTNAAVWVEPELPRELEPLVAQYGRDAVSIAALEILEYPACLVTSLTEILTLKRFLKG